MTDTTGQHCCVCAGTCFHTSEAVGYCWQHGPYELQNTWGDYRTSYISYREITVTELAEALDKLGLKAVPK